MGERQDQPSDREEQLVKVLRPGYEIATKFELSKKWMVKAVYPTRVLVFRRIGNEIVNNVFTLDEVVRIMPDSMDY